MGARRRHLPVHRRKQPPHPRPGQLLERQRRCADILYLDLSWDFVTNDILDNLHDQLTRHNVAPDLRQGLQNVLKTYKSFSVLGGLADKADDLQNPNLASIYRVGAEAIAGSTSPPWPTSKTESRRRLTTRPPATSSPA